MKKAKIFVIMPFTDEFYESYEMMKNRFGDDFDFSHAGDEDNQQNILADIITPIYFSDIVIADLTGLNPNVMYELGIAHSFNKKTIIITRDKISDLPFDLKQYRTKAYSTHFKQFFELIEYLEKNLRGALDGSVIFNNPVGDFLDKNKIEPQKIFMANPVEILVAETEKGFLDFLAEIEEDMQDMTSDIQNMTQHTQQMSSGLEECTSEIERVNKSGGSGIASFVRKQSKKAAGFMSTFSKQLKEHNSTISQLWSKIERNTLGLLENSYTSKSENKESLVNYLKAMYSVQQAIRTSNESTLGMKNASLNNIGIERSMNQAIRFLDEDLTSYLTMTEQMIASITRIFSKSKYIVGEIDFSQVTTND